MLARSPKVGWRLEWWVPAVYALLSAAWIYGSDTLVAAIAGSMERQRVISVYKGIGFVAVTALLLHAGLRWALRRERAAADRMRESEALLRAITDAIPDPVFLKGRDGRWLFANPATLRVLGKTMEQVMGRTDAEIYDNPDISTVLVETDRRIMTSGLSEVVEETIPGPLGFRTFLSSKAPYYGAESEVVGIIGNARDITERKQAETERQAFEARLQHSQKMESLGSLAGGVAHDMNNVLGAILGLASANLEIHPPDSPTHRTFDTISKAAIRGGKMVAGLLSFARQSPAEDRDIDLNVILREEVRLLERTTLAKIVLELDLAADLKGIRGDASALTHAFMNLCVNAVDAMPERGTLTLRTRNVQPDWVEVVVEDVGCGMSPEVLSKALDPFFTTKGVGKGTGLGLSLVYSTVKAHQGHLEILSTPGVGTQVVLRFRACSATPPMPDSGPGPAPALRATPHALRILLVDDDDLMLSSTQMLLETLGHQTTQTRSGEAALALIEAGCSPDLVILDLNMPGLGGAGTLAPLRALCPEVPILLATGRTDQIALDLVEAHPRVALLPKPFSLRDLQHHLALLAER